MRQLRICSSRLTTFLILMSSSVLSADESGPGIDVHASMPKQKLFFQYRVGSDAAASQQTVEVALETPLKAASLDQTVPVETGMGSLRLTRYLPNAELVQQVRPDATGAGPPAMELVIEGPTQSIRRWLIANDPERNQLISFIGTWRFMLVADTQQRNDLLEQFKTELSRPPRLLLSRDGESHHQVMEAASGSERKFVQWGCTVRVKSFYPHYARNNQTQEPVNLSEERVNPAALVEIHTGERTEQRWVFAKFPDFMQDEADGSGLRVTLDCPQAKPRPTPDFLLLTAGPERHEVWTRHSGGTVAQALGSNDRIEIAGSQYSFTVPQVVQSALMAESFREAHEKGGLVALELETTGLDDEPVKMWLTAGKQRVFQTRKGPLFVYFGASPAQVSGGHQ